MKIEIDLNMFENEDSHSVSDFVQCYLHIKNYSIRNLLVIEFTEMDSPLRIKLKTHEKLTEYFKENDISYSFDDITNIVSNIYYDKVVVITTKK